MLKIFLVILIGYYNAYIIIAIHNAHNNSDLYRLL